MSSLTVSPSVSVSNWQTSISAAQLKNTDRKIQNIVKTAFAELALSLTVGCLTLVLVDSVSILVCTAAISFALVHAVSKVAYKHFQGTLNNKENVTLLQNHTNLSRFSYLNILMRAGPGQLLHECGHALLALLLFKNPGVKISISPFKGGSTSYAISNGLTYFGKFFGKSLSRTIVASGGILASTGIAITDLILANYWHKSKPKVSQFLEWHAVSQLLTDILYGFSTFFVKQTMLSHDFVYLWVMAGINPLIPISLLIGLPLGTKLLLEFTEKKKKQTPMPEASLRKRKELLTEFEKLRNIALR